MATPCDNCWSKKAFGEKCWFYWEHKKRCSQFRQNPDEDPKYAEFV